MFGARVINLAHSTPSSMPMCGAAIPCAWRGLTEWLTRTDLARELLYINLDPNMRFPVFGGLIQRRGDARHDAVAWGFARGADMGVDLIQNCEVIIAPRAAGSP